MPSLKEVRNRITSVGSTMQITSAMKMVSAAKLKRAQDAIIQMRPYANKLKDLLENVSASVDSGDHVYARNTNGKNILIIPISSNRGLAGAFNSNIIKKTNHLINNDYLGYNITVLSIGKKVQDAFKRTAYNISGTDLPTHTSSLFDKLNFSTTSEFVEKVMESFLNKQFDKVVLVYNQFKNAAVQTPVEEQLLPVMPAKTGEKKLNVDYLFEPSQESIINERHKNEYNKFLNYEDNIRNEYLIKWHLLQNKINVNEIDSGTNKIGLDVYR